MGVFLPLQSLWEKGFSFEDVVQTGLQIIVALVMALLLVFFIRLKKERRRLLEAVRRGDFDVLDCTTYRMETDMDSAGHGAAYIQVEDGGSVFRCVDKFIIDEYTIRKSRGRSDVPMLLVKFRGFDAFELMTDEKMKMK